MGNEALRANLLSQSRADSSLKEQKAEHKMALEEQWDDVKSIHDSFEHKAHELKAKFDRAQAERNLAQKALMTAKKEAEASEKARRTERDSWRWRVEELEQKVASLSAAHKARSGQGTSFAEDSAQHARRESWGQRLLQQQQDKIDAQQASLRRKNEEIRSMRVSARTVAERMHAQADRLAKLESELRAARQAADLCQNKFSRNSRHPRAHSSPGCAWMRDSNPLSSMGARVLGWPWTESAWPVHL